MKDLEFLDYQIKILEESIRFKQIVGYKTIITESAIAGITDDALRSAIKTGVKDAITDTIDDVIKNASKEAAQDLLNGSFKKIGIGGDGFIKNNFSKIQKSVEQKLGQTLAPQEKLAIVTELKNLKINKQLDALYKAEGQKIVQSNISRIRQIAKGGVDDIAKQGLNTVDDVAKQEGKSLLSKFKNAKTFLGSKLDDVTKNKWIRKGLLKQKNGKWVISKRKALLLAGGLGIAYYTITGWFEKQDPPIKIDPDDTNNGGGSGTGGSGTGGSGTSFKSCADFPYTKGCSSSVVAEVQKCLGLTNDGKFGSKTESALVSGGYGKEITKEVYDKIKEKCGTTTTTTQDPNKLDVDSTVFTDVSYSDL